MFNILKIRTSAYKTQKAFAKELNISIDTVQGWERGRRNPSLSNQGKIAEFCKKYNIDMDTGERIRNKGE